jgi:catechol 2,3-dioxygenase-like lactoylglutathione lyase family enzyme
MTVPTPSLIGVHHTARPTWKLKETVEFYRDILGLPLVHCLAAKGWGPNNHPDFMHFFFDAGNGATIAFFYYLGTDCPPQLEPWDSHFYRATHTAWNCGSSEELALWQQRLEAKNWPVLHRIKHEIVESIYFEDPNGYMIEIGFPVRPFVSLDAEDARLSMEAAIQVDEEMKARGAILAHMQDIWIRKGHIVADIVMGVE